MGPTPFSPKDAEHHEYTPEASMGFCTGWHQCLNYIDYGGAQGAICVTCSDCNAVVFVAGTGLTCLLNDKQKTCKTIRYDGGKPKCFDNCPNLIVYNSAGRPSCLTAPKKSQPHLKHPPKPVTPTSAVTLAPTLSPTAPTPNPGPAPEPTPTPATPTPKPEPTPEPTPTPATPTPEPGQTPEATPSPAAPTVAESTPAPVVAPSGTESSEPIAQESFIFEPKPNMPEFLMYPPKLNMPQPEADYLRQYSSSSCTGPNRCFISFSHNEVSGTACVTCENCNAVLFAHPSDAYPICFRNSEGRACGAIYYDLSDGMIKPLCFDQCPESVVYVGTHPQCLTNLQGEPCQHKYNTAGGPRCLDSCPDQRAVVVTGQDAVCVLNQAGGACERVYYQGETPVCMDECPSPTSITYSKGRPVCVRNSQGGPCRMILFSNTGEAYCGDSQVLSDLRLKAGIDGAGTSP